MFFSNISCEKLKCKLPSLHCLAELDKIDFWLVRIFALLPYIKKYISKHRAGCSCNLYVARNCTQENFRNVKGQMPFST